MKCRFAALYAVFLLLVGLLPAIAQDYEKGLAAARAGDFATAVAEWRPLAKGGHLEAQFNLGAIYEAGLGVPKDAAEAAGWHALAAGQGHAAAQYNLGVMYADGRGVPRDDTKAATWTKKAAEQDHGKAQYNLGILYQTGRGVRKNYTQAQIWFDRAAANGVTPSDPNAQGPSPETVAESPSEEPPTSDLGSIEPSAGAAIDTGALEDADELLQPENGSAEVRSLGLGLTGFEPGDQPSNPETATADPKLNANQEPAGPPNVASLPKGQLRIAANFPAGTRYRLEVTETRERARDGGFVMAQTSVLGVDMVVKSAAGAGSLIEWTFGPATIKTAGDPNAGRLASELGKLLDGQKVEYRTDPNGKVTALDNPGQLSSFYEKSIDRVLSGMGTENIDPKLVENIRANLAPLLSEDYAATRALELPKLVHFFSGLELAAGKTYSRASVMSLPPSAEALPSTLDYELKWFDRAAGVAWLHWQQSVDPERAASAVKAYMEILAASSGQSVPTDLNIGAIEVSDGADYEIDLATGFPKQVIYTREVELFGFSQIEKRRIRVLQ